MPKLSPAERVWYQVADPLQGQAWLFWSPGICNSEHLDVWFRQSISSSRRTGRNTRDILLENIFLLDLSYKLNSQSNSKMAEVSSCYSQMKGHSLCQEIIYSTWKTRGGLKTRSICKSRTHYLENISITYVRLFVTVQSLSRHLSFQEQQFLDLSSLSYMYELSFFSFKTH